MPVDPYVTLGVPHDASLQEIRRAFRKLAREHHPDLNPNDPDAVSRFRDIARAWEILSGRSPQRRRGEAGPARAAPPGGFTVVDEDFADVVADAVERAEVYIERVVLPHYARFYSGRGLQMAARLLRDMESLGEPSWLKEPTSTWFSRQRAATLSGQVDVLLGNSPHNVTELRRYGRGYVLWVSPKALWNAGARSQEAVESAVMRLMVARFVQAIADRRVVLPNNAGPATWERLVASSRWADLRSTIGTAIAVVVVAVVVTLMAFAFFQTISGMWWPYGR